MTPDVRVSERVEPKRHREWIFLDEAADLPLDFWERIATPLLPRFPVPEDGGR